MEPLQVKFSIFRNFQLLGFLGTASIRIRAISVIFGDGRVIKIHSVRRTLGPLLSEVYLEYPDTVLPRSSAVRTAAPNPFLYLIADVRDLLLIWCFLLSWRPGPKK